LAIDVRAKEYSGESRGWVAKLCTSVHMDGAPFTFIGPSLGLRAKQLVDGAKVLIKQDLLDG
jgi:hypothetical protein